MDWMSRRERRTPSGKTCRGERRSPAWLALAAILLMAQPAAAQSADAELLGELIDRIERLQKELAAVRDQNERLHYEMDRFKLKVVKDIERLQLRLESTRTFVTVAPPVVHGEPVTAVVEPEPELEPEPEPEPEPPLVLEPEPEPMPEPELEPELEPEPEPEPEPAAVPTPPDGVGALEPLAERERSAYNAALRGLQDAEYVKLRKALAGFLRQYPDGRHAADAKYWIAESYYVMNNYERAEHYYKRVVDEHGRHSKRDDALLKIAYIRETRGEWERARALLQNLADSAKSEKMRDLAARRLERLQQEGR